MKHFLQKSRPEIIIPILAVLAIPLSIDNDAWFILNHGRYILLKGFTYTEPFTVHQGLDFSFEKWLTDVIFYTLYERFGTVGLLTLTFAIAACTAVVYYSLCMLVSDRNRLLSTALSFFTMLILCLFFERTRPQIFSYFFIILELLCLESYVRKRKIIYLVVLPIFSLFLMQLHSTMWLYFLIMFLPYLFDLRIFERITRIKAGQYGKKAIWISFAASAFAGTLNPNGYRSVIYIFKSISGGDLFDIGISELQPWTYRFALFVVIPIIAGISYMYTSQKKIDLRYAFFFSGTFLLALHSLRDGSYFAIVGGMISAAAWKNVRVGKIHRWKKLEMAMIATAVSVAMLYNFVTDIRQVSDTFYKETESKTILDRFTEEVEPDGKITLFTGFNDGAYAEFLGYRCYIDPRAELFLKSVNGKEDIADEYSSLCNGEISYMELQNKYGFNYWLIEKNRYFYHYIIEDPNYETVIEDDRYVILRASNQ